MAVLLRAEELDGILGYAEAVDAVEAAFRDWHVQRGINTPRNRLHAGDLRVTVHQGAAPALDASGLLVHAEQVEAHGDRQHYPSRGMPVHVLYGIATGELRAILLGRLSRDANDIRTAATTGVAVRLLTPPSASVLGLLGSGNQARTHLQVLTAVRPLRSVRVYSPTEERRRRFAAEMSAQLGLDVLPVDSARAAMAGADIVLAATNTNQPVFDGHWLEPGQTVCSIVASNVGLVKAGGARSKRREIDDDTLRRADLVVVNSIEQITKDEQGDLFDPLQAGVLGWGRVVELSAVAARGVLLPSDPKRIVVYKNNGGQGIADVAIAAQACTIALARGLGTPIGDGFAPSHG